ncbi:MAG: tRNA (adenosine(37)-N6)-threonylcarbamoyltransferase complex ATPase subunit type 1 TsaE [Candidatus Moraniibacteriota bacterium]
MNNSYTTKSAEETRSLGKKMAQTMAPGTFLCLTGNLGAGKTTFTQGFLEGLGAERPYVSPTFVIMKQYDLALPSERGIERIYHVDAYRVEAQDFAALGFAEWCADKKGVVILEWPERVAALLPPERIEITFKNLSENEREILVASEG